MKFQFLTLVSILILVAIISVGCNASSATVDEQSPATPEATEAVAETEEPVETEEAVPATEEPSADVTEEPVETEEVFVPENNDGIYLITLSDLSGVGDAIVSDIPLEEGRKWVMATATLANQTGPETLIETEHLVLVDVEGNEYTPGRMLDRIQPSLVNTTLASGETIYGFAIFAIPEESEPTALTWCPAGTCGEALETPAILSN